MGIKKDEVGVLHHIIIHCRLHHENIYGEPLMRCVICADRKISPGVACVSYPIWFSVESTRPELLQRFSVASSFDGGISNLSTSPLVSPLW